MKMATLGFNKTLDKPDGRRPEKFGARSSTGGQGSTSYENLGRAAIFVRRRLDFSSPEPDLSGLGLGHIMIQTGAFWMASAGKRQKQRANLTNHVRAKEGGPQTGANRGWPFRWRASWLWGYAGRGYGVCSG